jgi:5'-3' exonuclease
MKIVLIDSDSLAYIGGDDESIVLDKVDEVITNIINGVGATHYVVFTEGLNNNSFRKKIVQSYKSGRVGRPLPDFYHTIKQYLASDWNGYGIQGYETDDVIISSWRKLTNEYPFSEVIIATMDKDYKTYPITMFDTYFKRFGEVYNITENEANYNFYLQMLQGDSSDSVSGAKGVGIKKGSELLDSSTNYFITVCREYRRIYGSRWMKFFIKNRVQLRLLDNLRVEFSLNEV